MKLKSLVAKPLRLRGVQLVALGSIAFASQVACSEEAGPPAPPPIGSSGTATTAGTGGTGTAGTGTTAGTSAGGTFGTAGSGTAGSGTAGTFGTSGSTTGGTGGSGGSAGSTAGTGGTGGVVEPPKPFCDTQTAVTLPYTVNTTYQLSGWGGIAPTVITANEGIMPAANGCMTRVPNAVGGCAAFKYTPPVAPAEPAPLWIQWIRQWDPNHLAPPICMPTTAKAVTFAAKGEVGGEKILVSAGEGMQAKEITLTTEWATYFVSVDGLAFNSFTSGTEEGFAWSLDPTAETPSMVFYLDNIQWVAEAPTE